MAEASAVRNVTTADRTGPAPVWVALELLAIAVLRYLEDFRALLVRWRTNEADSHGLLGAAVFAVLLCLLFIRNAWDNTLVIPLAGGTGKVWRSKPVIGVFLGLMSALLSLAGSVLGFRGGPR